MANQDQVTLVNEQDEVIGIMDKIEAHRGEGKLHRASSVFLFRKGFADEVELLIQQRSDKKIVGAGQWANTVCGNVWPDESYEECARRRLEFELGIDEVVKFGGLTIFRYQAKCNEEFSENEIVHIFLGWFDGDIEPNEDEVAETQWISWKEVQDLPGRLEWAPWFKLFILDQQVKTAVEKYVINR
jgi:isopentenyl-diphosphate delta-isomerase